ncbi:hypothetical protein [Streptomyces genisteinicus]|uniref:Uncharacterized protein n=1 Tax=Streptomyces genisteinicus TaxID=2768068 RepID=A0A7H0I1T5_9ACTN|nr:hypothetical protein [Streptomyces genisteinicus]QNP66751.1 hypothetical protein IAG43_30065 [Streptomyces genisteinicus]
MSEKHAAASQSGHLCPTCGRQLPATVERHKTMGVYVPVYSDGPCDNSACSRGPAAAPATRTSETPAKEDVP